MRRTWTEWERSIWVDLSTEPDSMSLSESITRTGKPATITVAKSFRMMEEVDDPVWGQDSYLKKGLASIHWNAYNDGSGSGLDADLLDGRHGGRLMSPEAKIYQAAFTYAAKKAVSGR